MTSKTDSGSTVGFQSALFKAWQADFHLRCRVPGKPRQVVGLGASVNFGSDHRISVGDALLRNNHDVRWFCVRDTVDEFDNEFGVASVASVARASLSHGLPRIRFDSPEAWNLQNKPLMSPEPLRPIHLEAAQAAGVLSLCSFPQEAGVLTAVSAAMTRTAFQGLLEDGPVHEEWFDRRSKHAKPFHVPSPVSWMPEPHLQFSGKVWPKVYSRMTRAIEHGTACICPVCKAVCDLEFLLQPRTLSTDSIRLQELAAGTLKAVCPVCEAKCRWSESCVVPAHRHRRYTEAFKRDFVAAIATGLSLRMPDTATYMGRTFGTYNVEGYDLPLARHAFKHPVADGVFYVLTPKWSKPRVKPGQVVNSVDIWIDLLPVQKDDRVLAKWLALPASKRWTSLPEVCGGSQYISLLQQAWLRSRAVYVYDTDDAWSVIMPAAYLGDAAGLSPVEDLWWNFEPSDDYLDRDLKSFVFPGLPVSPDSNLRFSVDGFTELDLAVPANWSRSS